MVSCECDITYVAVVGRGLQALVLLASENVNGHEVALCVSVLASLTGGNIGDLQGGGDVKPGAPGDELEAAGNTIVVAAPCRGGC